MAVSQIEYAGEIFPLIQIDGLDPMGAPRQTQRDRWAKRPVVQRYHAYRDELRLALRGYELPDVLYIEFHIGFPKSYTKKQRMELNGQPHQLKPDIDNLCKAVMDALVPEDRTVHTIMRATKLWSIHPAIVIAARKKS